MVATLFHFYIILTPIQSISFIICIAMVLSIKKRSTR